MRTKKQITYKGLDENFQCRGYQFEVGKTYTHQGEVEVCKTGFHSCVNPFDVLNYYDLTQRFAVVEIGGAVSRQEGGDTKIASVEITIKAELSLPDFVQTAVEWLLNFCSDSDSDSDSGNYSKLAASGNYSKLAASGNYSKLAASGNYSNLAASGYDSKLASSGDYSKLASSGNCSKLAASGYDSKLASSGNCSKLAASGDYSKLASSGDYSKLASSGDYSKLASSGDYSKLAASGEDSVVMSAGLESSFLIGKGGCAAIMYKDATGKTRIRVAYEGEDGIEAGVTYKVNLEGDFYAVQ